MASLQIDNLIDWRERTHDPLWVGCCVVAPWTKAIYDSCVRSSLTAEFADGTTHTVYMSVPESDVVLTCGSGLISLVEAKLVNAIEEMREYARSKKLEEDE
jgi:hypothetical protein